MKKFSLLSGLMLTIIAAFAQGDSAANTGLMTRDLKIYVAVTVLAIVLTCIFIFLFYIEQQLKQLEAARKS